MPMSKLYLEHYGVLGMKWGIRRYQPYPSGKKKGVYLGDTVGNSPLKYKSPLVRNVKNYAKLAAVQAVAMVIPGVALAYNVNQIQKVSKYNLDGTDYTKKDGEYEDLKNVSKKKREMTAEEDVKLVNPGNQAGRVNNCGFCTVTMEMRRRGYDVTARRKAHGIAISDYNNWFNNIQPESHSSPRQSGESRKAWVSRTYNELCQKLEAKGDKARGYVAFDYQGSHTGHTLFWEVQNGNVIFYDGQSGKINPGDVFSFSDQRYAYGRLDTCTLKPEVTQACVSSDYKEKTKGG